MEKGKTHHCRQHHNDTNPKEYFCRHPRQDKSTQKAPDRAEYKIEAGSKRSFVQTHIQTFHQDSGSRCIGSHVDTHMAHDPDKAQQNKRLTQQGKTFFKGGRFTFRLLLFYLRSAQQENRQYRNDHIDREKYPPAQSERRNSCRCTPHSDIGSQERGYRLDKLPESKAASQPIAIDQIRQQRVQRRLHQGITDTQQGKREQHQRIAITKDWQKQRQESHHQAEQHSFLPPDAVHQHTGRDGEDQEPKEHQ